MDTVLNKIIKENKEVYITGDFNIDLLIYNNIPKHQEFYDLMSAMGIFPKSFILNIFKKLKN